jgi:Gpi18-like mannosyltransferase
MPIQFARMLSRIRRQENWLIVGLGLILALLLRLTVFSAENLDLTNFVFAWYRYIRNFGGFLALKENLGDYTPLYLYMITIATYFRDWIPRIFGVKLISITFDFVCGLFAYKIVRWRFSTGSAPLLALMAVLFAPTVILNSAYWGQVDAVYTAGLLASLYFLLKEQELRAFSAFGLAFAFKLQAIFFSPVLFILWLKRQVTLKSFLLIPVVYVVTIIPAWLIGRPLSDLLTIYLKTSEGYQALTLQAPNFYQWFPKDEALRSLLTPMALLFAASVVFLLLIVTYKIHGSITGGALVDLALVSVLLLPYFLPRMHERYFFAADVLSIVFAFYYPRLFFVPIGIGLISFFSYGPFLFHVTIIPLPILALAELAMLVVVSAHFVWSLLQQQQALAQQPTISKQSD